MIDWMTIDRRTRLMSDFQDYLDKCTFCTDSFMSYAFDGDTELATTLIKVLLNRDDLVVYPVKHRKQL